MGPQRAKYIGKAGSAEKQHKIDDYLVAKIATLQAYYPSQLVAHWSMKMNTSASTPANGPPSSFKHNRSMNFVRARAGDRLVIVALNWAIMLNSHA